MQTMARRFAVLLSLTLLLASHGLAADVHGTAASAAPAALAPKGTLVIIGGALRADNHAVWQRIVTLAGGPGTRIAVFGSAAANPERSARTTIEHLASHGAKAFFVPVATRLAGTDYRASADDPGTAALVATAAGAFFVGGDQRRITEALRRPDGSNTRVLDALWAMYRNGGVIAGTSAGAAIMSKSMFADAPSVLATLKHGVRVGTELTAGLGFIGNDVFIDQHFLARGRFGRMLPAMLALGYKLGLGIDENTAMIAHPNRDIEVFGHSGALLMDLRTATTTPGALNVRNARISYLDHGDRYNIARNAFTPAPGKVAIQADPTDPDTKGPIFSADILANKAIVEVMTKLIESEQREATGLAFGSALDPSSEQGFLFELIRTTESKGLASPAGGATSVYDIRLDLVPVKMRQPLFLRHQNAEGQPVDRHD